MGQGSPVCRKNFSLLADSTKELLDFVKFYRKETMLRKFTTLLLIGLMLALPLRAVAGMAMFGCAPNHHTANFVSPEHSVAPSMQDMSGCHEGMQAPSDAHDNCHQDHGSTGKHAATTCSACGDCCVGALSIPVIAQIGLSHEPASALITFLDHPYAGFHPEGPDRPPRLALS